MVDFKPVTGLDVLEYAVYLLNGVNASLTADKRVFRLVCDAERVVAVFDMVAEVRVNLDGSVLARLSLRQSDGIVVKQLLPSEEAKVRNA